MPTDSQIIASLISQARAALNPTPSLDEFGEWLVYDGYPITDDRTRSLSVGVEDPTDPARADSSDADFTFAHANGRALDETGYVRCALLAWDGGNDIAVARDQVDAAFDVLRDLVRHDLTPVGLPGVWSAHISSTRLYQNATAEDGVDALRVFTVAYRARVPH